MTSDFNPARMFRLFDAENEAMDEKSRLGRKKAAFQVGPGGSHLLGFGTGQ
jgi:hypothetical protein